MKRINFAAAGVVILGLLSGGCGQGAVSTEVQLPSPTAALVSTSPPESAEPTTVPSASPTAAVPTATPGPSLPASLAEINYRTLSELKPLFSIPLGDVIDLAFSPDHRYLRLRQGNPEGTHTDIFVDLQLGQDIFSLVGNQRVYFTPDSSLLEVLDENGVTLIALANGNSQRVYNSRYQAAALSTASQLLVELEEVAGQDPGTVLHVIDLSTAEEAYQIYINAILDQEAVHFDDDGELLAASYLVPPGTYVAAVWDARRGYLAYTNYGFSEIALHPFGSEVALANAKQSYISLVSTVTWGQDLYLGLAEDGPAYRDLAYAAGGRLIYALSGDVEAEAAFWYPPSGERLDFDPGTGLLAVAVSPDRQLLAVSHTSGEVVIWGLPE